MVVRRSPIRAPAAARMRSRLASASARRRAGSLSGASSAGCSGLAAASDTRDTVALNADLCLTWDKRANFRRFSDIDGEIGEYASRCEGKAGHYGHVVAHHVPHPGGARMTEITEGYGFRGRTIIDLDGEKIGKIDDVYEHRRRYAVTDPKERVRLGTDERTDQETISETLGKERIETDDDARA